LNRKKANSIFISFATGYSGISPEKRLNNFWVYEASVGVIIKNHWVLSLKFEFWKSSYKFYYSPGTDLYDVVDLKGMASILNAGYKINLFKNKLGIYFGIGFGEYNISEGPNEHYRTDSYNLLNITTGISFYARSDLSIDCKGSYFALYTFREQY